MYAHRGGHVALSWGLSLAMTDCVMEFNGKQLLEYPTTLAALQEPNTALEPNVVGYDVVSDANAQFTNVTSRNSVGGVYLG